MEIDYGEDNISCNNSVQFTPPSVRLSHPQYTNIPRNNSNASLPPDCPEAVRSIIDWNIGRREGNWDVFVSFIADQIGWICNFARIIVFTNPVDTVIISLVNICIYIYIVCY